jgi:hypothetical protein
MEPIGNIKHVVEHIYEGVEKGKTNHCRKFQLLK